VLGGFPRFAGPGVDGLLTTLEGRLLAPVACGHFFRFSSAATSARAACADFHALRHIYVSALAAAGVVGKELQELARHSDPRLTLGIYTHARAEALGASVARLQLPAAAGENPLARLTRSGLEGAVIALAVALRTLTGCTVVAPRVALPMETGADGNETGVHHRPGRTGRSDSPQTVNQRHPETA